MKVRLGVLAPCSMTVLGSKYAHVYKAEEEIAIRTANFVLSMMDALQIIGAKSHEIITLHPSDTQTEIVDNLNQNGLECAAEAHLGFDAVPKQQIESEELMQARDRKYETIIDYIACTFLNSLIDFPCLPLPAPMRARTLPFGRQLVAPPGPEDVRWEPAKRLETAGFACCPAPMVFAA